MSRLEDELRSALQRESPSLGFTERVLARAAEQKRSWSFAALFGMRGMRWAVAGALALVMVGAGLEYQREREERARGEAAREQVLLALRIAGTKLRFAQERVQQLEGPSEHINTEKVQ